ncbi:hypothetical protein [Ottowia sp.]
MTEAPTVQVRRAGYRDARDRAALIRLLNADALDPREGQALLLQKWL